MTPPALTALLLAGAVALAGCGISDPDATPPTPVTSTPTTAHRPRTPPAQRHGRGLAGERALLARFARAWVTYTFATLPAQQRQLAALATGPLARQLGENAERDLQAQYVRVANVRSRGVVEAIVVRGHAPAIVVTREQLTTNGQTQVGWELYLASVTATKAGLRVATWTPASSG